MENFVTNAWPLIAALLLINSLLFLLLSPGGRGALGEWAVRRKLRELEPLGFRALHNVYLKDGRGITQIDHIVAGPTGIAVLETKTLAGKLYATSSPRWQIYYFGRRYMIDNAVHQNLRHVNAVAETLSIERAQLQSLVVLAGVGENKSRRPPRQITYLRDLNDALLKRKGELSPSDTADVVRRLSKARLPNSFRTRLRHRMHLKAQHGTPLIDKTVIAKALVVGAALFFVATVVNWWSTPGHVAPQHEPQQSAASKAQPLASNPARKAAPDKRRTPTPEPKPHAQTPVPSIEAERLEVYREDLMRRARRFIASCAFPVADIRNAPDIVALDAAAQNAASKGCLRVALPGDSGAPASMTYADELEAALYRGRVACVYFPQWIREISDGYYSEAEKRRSLKRLADDAASKQCFAKIPPELPKS